MGGGAVRARASSRHWHDVNSPAAIMTIRNQRKPEKLDIRRVFGGVVIGVWKISAQNDPPYSFEAYTT